MSQDSSRDRDPAGRPRSARPRDELGRPLDYEQGGTPGVPEDLALSPTEALAEARRLLEGGLAFHAHEVLEAAWKAAPDAERDLWRGLAQLAVGVTHAQRGNLVGAARLLRRGADRIMPWHPRGPHDIDVAGIVSWAEQAAGGLESAGPDSLAIALGRGSTPPKP